MKIVLSKVYPVWAWPFSVNVYRELSKIMKLKFCVIRQLAVSVLFSSEGEVTHIWSINELSSGLSISVWISQTKINTFVFVYHMNHGPSNWVISFNTLRPWRIGQHFADDIFKRIFFNENVWISIKISLKCVPKGPVYNITALIQITAWCRPGNKPLSEPMADSLLTHICVTRPQWFHLCLG